MTQRFLFDASSILVLAEIGYLEFFCDTIPIFTTTSVIINEVTQKLTPSKKIVEDLVIKGKIFVLSLEVTSHTSYSLYFKLGLHLGEISLLVAANQKTDIIVIDDLVARSVARAEGVPFTGLLGLLVALKKAGKVSQETALAILLAITKTNFRLSVSLYNAIRTELES
ncbi:MAG: DUF3368 domain-containing protein [Candidatus Thorarchaeota archaeon]